MMSRLPGTTMQSVWLARPCHDRRSGISLLEVVFSIGVVMIGLVGIASLLPLGGALARKGATADAGAQLGANAAREFTARGMAIPQGWRWFNASATPPRFTTVLSSDGVTPPAGMSFCLDPTFIAAVDPTSATYESEMTVRARFPLNANYDNSLLYMPRITLASPYTPTGVLAPTAADSLFLGSDDLVFDLPGDRTLGPVQNFSFLNSRGADPLKRNSQGRISWMATIVPKLDRIFVPPGPPNPTGINPTDEYTLSIVVFDRRPVDRDLVGATVSEDVVSERVVTVYRFHSGAPAFSGGDILLRTRARPGVDIGDDLDLRSGDWLMFSGQKGVINFNVVPPDAPISTVVHKWYRVVNVGEEPVYDGTAWFRDVTVVGPDWDRGHMMSDTQVTIVRGVVQVMERTIRLETSSMWTH